MRNRITLRNPKIKFQDLTIEVTRRCNMHCAHCLRGEPQNLDISKETIEKIISKTAGIGCLTFTGGEPALNIKAIKQTLTLCKAYQVPVYSFYVVTNGKKVTHEFLKTMLDWYCYCTECAGDDDMTGVAISSDAFHEPIPKENILKLQGLSFFRPNDHKIQADKPFSLINMGRARNLTGITKREMHYVDEIDTSFDGQTVEVNDAIIAMTVKGEILAQCDYEYDRIDDIYICDVDNISSTFRRMATDVTYDWKHPVQEVTA